MSDKTRYGTAFATKTITGLNGDTNNISIVPNSFSRTTATEVNAVHTIISINAITPGTKFIEPFSSSLYNILVSGMIIIEGGVVLFSSC